MQSVVRNGRGLHRVQQDSNTSIYPAPNFRFISFNVPSEYFDYQNGRIDCHLFVTFHSIHLMHVQDLHYLEDRYAVDPVRSQPSVFEQEDALESVAQMGGQVARIYALSIQGGASSPRFHIARDVDDSSWSVVPNTSNPKLFLNQDLLKGLDSAVGMETNFVGLLVYITFKNSIGIIETSASYYPIHRSMELVGWY